MREGLRAAMCAGKVEAKAGKAKQMFFMPDILRNKADRHEWEKHLRIERWLMNKSLKKEWRAVLREYAEKEQRDFKAVAKALGAPLDFCGELLYPDDLDYGESPESLP